MNFAGEMDKPLFIEKDTRRFVTLRELLPPTVDEARLPDVMLDLSDIYDHVFPKPQGDGIFFTVFDKKTTYEKAVAKVEGILAGHGLVAAKLDVIPGPEMEKPADRKIIIALAKGDLM